MSFKPLTADGSFEIASAPVWPIIWCRWIGEISKVFGRDTAPEAASRDGFSAFSMRFDGVIVFDAADDV